MEHIYNAINVVFRMPKLQNIIQSATMDRAHIYKKNLFSTEICDFWPKMHQKPFG